MASDERVVKLLLPARLIRELDQALVDGIGGFGTRAEFVREAVEALLLDLKHEAAPPEPEVPADRAARALTAPPSGGVDEQAHSTSQQPSSAPTEQRRGAIIPPTRGWTMNQGEARLGDGPIFGMHNRDYPSIWALCRIATATAQGSLAYEECADAVTKEAWGFAKEAVRFDSEGEMKVSALFPTNSAKPQSASEGFRAFAIGVPRTDKTTGELWGEGPLFVWKGIQLQRGDSDRLQVGVTESGYQLLDAMRGLSLSLPHSQDLAKKFFDYLKAKARGDWDFFLLTLRTVERAPNRNELLEAFGAEKDGWTPSVAATHAQGYLARTREWGLVAPKMQEGRYVLTEFGRETVTSAKGRG